MTRAGIAHVDLVVGSLQRSLPFYRELLAPLGYTGADDIVGERGETVWYLSIPGRFEGSLGLREASSRVDGAPHDRYGVGIHHVCFYAGSRDVVDERFGWLRERGAVIESEPREYAYTPGYYAVFFYDPDGIKLEIVHRP
ncbi:MAG: VOC family protein [Solirubrobacteraceae bacterium]|jgi:catechol 2,3-dioxygenase-like lactoylglutathione lyase family enzyme